MLKWWSWEINNEKMTKKHRLIYKTYDLNYKTEKLFRKQIKINYEVQYPTWKIKFFKKLRFFLKNSHKYKDQSKKEL